MLAVSPLSCCNNEREGEMENFSIRFDDFSCGNLLDDIDDLFISMGDEDVLPDLEIDQDLLAEFSVSGGEESETNILVSTREVEENGCNDEQDRGSGLGSDSNLSRGEEIMSKRDELVTVNRSLKVIGKGRKSRNKSKSSQGKRKMKVDWTPELHKRFVQAVEQLGMDKAVPSRILELMGIDCLTRHNIASHLQKYRSHQKHLRAREAEVASWNQRRQMYGGVQRGSKRDMNPWFPSTMGFSPPTPLQPFPPLHVWGHPTVDQSLMHMWPKHLVRSPIPWAAPPPPPPDPRYWHPHHQVPNTVTPGTPCFPPTLTTTRFPAPPVPGIPPQAMYKLDHNIGVPSGQSHSHPPFDFHPSKESIDAAVGDVLSNPWLPLPIGLKPPSLESVLVDLQRQGIHKIPPTCS